MPLLPLELIGFCESLVEKAHLRFFKAGHNGCYWEFLSEKYLIQIWILGTKELEIRNSKDTFVVSILKVDYFVAICFQISYSLVPRIGICLKYFLDKNLKRQPLCRRFGCAHDCAGIRLSLRQRRFEGLTFIENFRKCPPYSIWKSFSRNALFDFWPFYLAIKYRLSKMFPHSFQLGIQNM